MNDFAHLHGHSEYSLRHGSMSIQSYLEQLQTLGIEHAALTDTHNLFGGFKFYRKAQEYGMNPLIGADVYIGSSSAQWSQNEGSNRLRLLVINSEGYSNLSALLSQSYANRHERNGLWIDMNSLVTKQDGLWILGPSRPGAEDPIRSVSEDSYKKALQAGLDQFGDRFLAEIPVYGLSRQRVIKQLNFADEENVPAVVTRPSYFPRRDQFQTYRLRLAVQSNTPLEELNEIPDHCRKQYPVDMEQYYDFVPEKHHDALERTSHIAQSCDFEFNTSSLRLPAYPDQSTTKEQLLENKCQAGITKKTLKASEKDIEKRLNHELEIINGMNFTDYFLIVADIVEWAKNHDIRVGPGRGSAAGSLVSYLLNITDVDPFQYDLVFERFLNPDRNEMPDIDIDFADHHRDKVIDYIRRRFGRSNVAQIITFGNMKAKNSIRDIGRIRNEPQDRIDELASRISNYDDNPLDNLLEKIKDPNNQTTQEWIQQAQQLQGFVRNPSTHAAGLLVSESTLKNEMPLYYPQESDPQPATQFDMYDVEKLGYLKLDILGLTTLSLLDLTLENIPDEQQPELEDLPDEDPETLNLFADASLEGIFQFESEGGRELAHKMKPKNKREVVDCIALNRPGPAAYRENYLNRRAGDESIDYPHKDLRDILEDTYGLIIYQEQVMAIARTIGGFTWSQADSMRKAMGKKVPELMEKMKSEFVEGALDQGYREDFARDLFKKLAKFAEYGFNRSHSAAYGEITYQTAYLKAHFTPEFYAAFLTIKSNDRDRIARIARSMSRDGIKLLAPRINQSEACFTSEDQGIRYGLEAIKHVGNGLARTIEQERSNGIFEGIIDFLKRIPPQQIQPQALQALAAAGCFDDFDHPRSWIIERADHLLKRGELIYQESQSGQSNLFGSDPDQITDRLNVPDEESWNRKKIKRAEKAATGIVLSEV